MEISEFLLWLASGLGATFIFSYFAERWEWFLNLRQDTKRLYSTIGASLLAIVAYVTVTYVPVEFWVAISPYWQIVVGVIINNYGTQVFHKYDKTLPQ